MELISNRVGEILHKGWILKRSLTKNISNGVIDSYYEKARSAGALGGKLWVLEGWISAIICRKTKRGES